MFPAGTGVIVNRSGLDQLSDAKGIKLTFTKTVGTEGKACERDFYTASGTNSDAYSWAYTAEPIPSNPILLYVRVKKTAL